MMNSAITKGFTYTEMLGTRDLCEHCGKPTMLFNEKLLKPYNEFYEDQQEEEFALPFETNDEIPF